MKSETIIAEELPSYIASIEIRQNLFEYFNQDALLKLLRFSSLKDFIDPSYIFFIRIFISRSS